MLSRKPSSGPAFIGGGSSTTTGPMPGFERVAVNQLITALRSEARKDSAERATSSALPLGSTAIDCSIDVRQALDALPTRQRLYLILQQVEQMRVHEIARATGAAEGTVKSGLHDARRKMFDTLGADYEA